MSFVRPRRGLKKKAFVRKLPQWDDTVSDLDSYRATPEEVRLRKEAHKSQNHIAVKLEKMRKEKQRQHAGLTNVEARHVAIMKEVLHDQQQLDFVLNKTDQMMSVVKDLFGDDAKKFTGFPHVTVPPGNQRSSRSNLVPAAPEIRTRSEILSESVMSQSALNDLSDEEWSDSDSDDERTETVDFQSQMDLQRFQHFLQQEESRNFNNSAVPSSAAISQTDMQLLRHFVGAEGPVRDKSGGATNQSLSTIGGSAGPSIQFSQHRHGPAHSTHLLADTAAAQQGGKLPGYVTPPQKQGEQGIGHTTPSKSALNDTGKVKKSRRRVPQQESNQNSATLNMSDMRKVLEALEAEITDFEHKTGRRSVSDVQRTETFTGYTVAFVTAVTKLTHYLKETEMRLQAEMMVREQLTQDVRQLALTMDSLTQEVIMTQEEYGKLFSEHQRYRQQMQGEMALLQAQVLDVKHHQSAEESHGSEHSTPRTAASAGSERADENFGALPEHVTQPSAAVLLSPVVRKTRVHNGPQPRLLEEKRQRSLVNLTSLAEDEIPQQEQRHTEASLKGTAVGPKPYSSQSLATQSDPPRLTQLPPVMATVSVPRPIPLVQTNLAVSLAAAGPLAQAKPTQSSGASGLTTSQLVSRNMKMAPFVADNSRGMENQIAELNRQHAEAQKRLQSLLTQQKRQHNQLEELHMEDKGDGVGGQGMNAGSKSHVVQEGTIPSTVSPPISPISQRSEHFTGSNPLQRLTTMSREIKVALPTVDPEVSAGSLGSPL